VHAQQRVRSAIDGSGHDEKERNMMGFNDMMSGWGGGWISWTMYLGMIVFWVGMVALAALGARGLARSGAVQPAQQLRQESAADVLKRRYAAGEIDAAEFEQKRRDLF
jgi:putative membrane protein